MSHLERTTPKNERVATLQGNRERGDEGGAEKRRGRRSVSSKRKSSRDEAARSRSKSPKGLKNERNKRGALHVSKTRVLATLKALTSESGSKRRSRQAGVRGTGRVNHTDI